jgi:hypothetical protein
MLDEKELIQVRDYVIGILPELLSQQPEIARVIEGIIAVQCPRRDEFARLLDEVREERLEAKRRHEQTEAGFGKMEHRFEQMDARFEDLREETNQRFAQVDQRFEQVDQRFEQVDQRFEQVDQHFEQVDQHLAQIDQRLDNMDQTMLGLKREVVQLRQGQETIIKQANTREAWLLSLLGNEANRKGAIIEEQFAAGLRYGLKNPNISAETLRLRQKLEDKEGQIFKPGYTTEVDIIVDNDKIILFELKSTGRPDDVDAFASKVELMARQNQDKHVTGTFVVIGASEAVRQRCLELGIQLVEE